MQKDHPQEVKKQQPPKRGRHNLVPVLLTRSYQGFNAGERPGFEPKVAANLVKQGAAIYIELKPDGEWQTKKD